MQAITCITITVYSHYVLDVYYHHIDVECPVCRTVLIPETLNEGRVTEHLANITRLENRMRQAEEGK